MNLDPKMMASILQNAGPLVGGVVQARQQAAQPVMPEEAPQAAPRLRPGRDDPQYAQERYTTPMQAAPTAPIPEGQYPRLAAQPIAPVGQPTSPAMQLMALQSLYGRQ